MELAEYEREGVTGKNITYDDNKPLLDLMLQVGVRLCVSVCLCVCACACAFGKV
jgi:hypothetical protein